MSLASKPVGFTQKKYILAFVILYTSKREETICR